MHGGWVYILPNPPKATLYVGVTNGITRRISEHRSGVGSVFTRRYGLHRLVYAVRHEDILVPIQREKAIKDWPRAWKIRLIRGRNPDWNDLYDPFA